MQTKPVSALRTSSVLFFLEKKEARRGNKEDFLDVTGRSVPMILYFVSMKVHCYAIMGHIFHFFLMEGETYGKLAPKHRSVE